MRFKIFDQSGLCMECSEYDAKKQIGWLKIDEQMVIKRID